MLRLHAAIAASAAITLAGCGGDDASPLTRSCRGERHLDCDPFEYSIAISAALEPARLAPLDGMTRAQFRVETQTCEMPPAASSVQVQARLEGPPDDAGVPRARIVDLVTLEDDGLLGDPVAGDGIIDVSIENPFTASIPSDTDIVLRFVPVIGGCDGEAIEIDYRTGRRR